tara:strand:+ start:164 stop:274 length:111 start_codon:yes stop_codon:yes gene_type:complete
MNGPKKLIPNKQKDRSYQKESRGIVIPIKGIDQEEN